MAGGNNRSFLRDPQEFLRTHHIIAQAQGKEWVTKLHNGIYNIDLVSMGTMDNKLTSKDWIRLENYEGNRQHLPGSQPVPAFFLEAKRNQSSTCVLDSRCNYVFTADLSGCLFAAYGPKANHVTVEHVNEHDVEHQVHSEDFIMRIVGKYQNSFYRILFPARIDFQESKYVKKYEGLSCVIGVMEGGEWHFYYKPCKDSVEELGAE